MTTIFTPQGIVWDALQVDLTEAGGTEPVDSSYIVSLIATAESNLAAYIGKSISTFEGDVPEELTQAICLEVQARYRNRLMPEVPPAYFALIAGHRVWGFG
jgi:hypothetical protein